MKLKFKGILKWLYKNKLTVTVLVIFCFELFLRFYQIYEKNPFGYDQVDNAWAAKNIIVNHSFPLVGMVAKANSGVYIGPAYYYLISPFYFLTGLNPIASGVIAGFTSIFSFWVIYYVTRKLFGLEVALIALVINTFSFDVIYYFDRIQWPVNFIPGLSLLIFYFLYKSITGDVKKIIPLGLAMGFMFHVHFTAIFFPIIILLTIPFFKRTKDVFKYYLISGLIFLLCLVPQIINIFLTRSSSGNASYFAQNYHGFHIRRAIQIIGDAFIQFDHFLHFDILKKIKLVIPLFFFITYFKKKGLKNKGKFMYLIALWFLVPWVIFTTYSGEISDYYFSVNRYLALIVLSYLIFMAWSYKSKIVKIFVGGSIATYSIYNFVIFFPYHHVSLKDRTPEILRAVEQGRRIEFTQGAPESYLFYYYMMKKGVEVY